MGMMRTMPDLRERIISRLGMKLREGQPEFTDDEVVRKLESRQDAYRRLVERETELHIRFKTLSEIAGETATKMALEATPSEEKMTLLRWLDPKGNDFLGSGMAAEEYMLKRNIGTFQRNLSSQMADEQRRRIDIIIRLSVEYHRIRSEDIHGTASLESAIEPIISGEESERFDERIGWMMMRDETAFQGEDAERYKETLDRREALWAPAVAICREFTGAWKPPPEDRPRYETWEEMLEKEPGIVRVGSGNSRTKNLSREDREQLLRHPLLLVGHDESTVWMKDRDAPLWGTPKMWNSMVFRGEAPFWELCFKAGVRWRGPRIPSENGYWHRDDGEKFPDDEEQFFGNNYHRIYDARTLRGWMGRQDAPK
jgi:hypothetical protein